MIRRECTSIKSIDGGSCSARVPCDGVIEGQTMIGGCGEPCTFVMHGGELTIEDAFRAGFAYARDRGAFLEPKGAEWLAVEDEAWIEFNGEKR